MLVSNSYSFLRKMLEIVKSSTIAAATAVLAVSCLVASCSSSDSSSAPETVTQTTVETAEATEATTPATTVSEETSVTTAETTTMAPAAQGVDQTNKFIIDNGDLIFVAPDEQGVCWFYNPDKAGLGMCTMNLVDPPLVPMTPTDAQATELANSIGFDENAGVGYVLNVAVGSTSAPADTQKLEPGEYIDFRGIRCEAVNATDLTCSFQDQEFTYSNGTVTPELQPLHM